MMKSEKSIAYWLEKWKKNNPESHPVVPIYLIKNTHFSASTVYNYLYTHSIRFEPESVHKIRTVLEYKLKNNKEDEKITKKSLFYDKKSTNAAHINKFLIDNPKLEVLRVAHNNRVKELNEEKYAAGYHAVYYRENIDKRKEYNKTHREEINAYYRRYYNNPITGYKEKHLNLTDEQREKNNAYVRELYWNDPDKYRAKGREYYHRKGKYRYGDMTEEQREKIRENARIYYQKNKARLQKQARERYRLKRSKDTKS